MLSGKKRARLQDDAEQFVLGDHELDEEERNEGEGRFTDEAIDADTERLVKGDGEVANGQYDQGGDGVLEEKNYKFVHELPNPNTLVNARPKIPGAFPIASSVYTLQPSIHPDFRLPIKGPSATRLCGIPNSLDMHLHNALQSRHKGK